MSEQTAGRIGRRGGALLFFALLDFVYCVGLLTAPRPLTQFYVWMGSYLPLTGWAVIWGAVGATCLYFAFCRYDTPAFMAAVALKVAWGLLSFLGQLMGVADRGYLSGVIWLAFAWLVFLIAGGIPPALPRPARWRPWTL